MKSRLSRLVSALKALAGGAATGSFFGCFALANAGAPGLQKACPGAPALGDHAVGAGRVSAVNERLELTLDDGRLLRITGLDPPRPTPDGPDLDVDSSLKLAGWLVGKDIVFRLDEARPDRWGRLAAQVFAPAGASPSPLLAVAPAALDAGLARFEPGPAAHPCRAALLAAEAAARAAALGLWADPYYAVIPSGDHGAFPEKAGTSIIVEGRVTGVAQDAFRTTLLFGQRRGWDFSVTILQRNTKIFSAAGFDVEKLKGQTIRIRGLLDLRFGPQIELSSPDEIETITPDTGGASPKPDPAR